MNKYIILIAVLLFSFLATGSAQTLSVGQGYKHGDIYWQSSADGQTWENIGGENDLEYEVPHTTSKYYRAKVVSNNEEYFSSVHKANILSRTKKVISFNVPAGTTQNSVKVSFAPLKYNKQFAISYTSDDQKLDGWRIFKYFNGGWIDDVLNYHYQMPRSGGGYAPRALTYTDGCGVIRRFSVSSSNFFNRKKWGSNTEYRILEKNPQTNSDELVWQEQLEINTFDGACSFHDVRVSEDKVATSIEEIRVGIIESNDLIINKLKLGRKPMVMAEPAGNYNYVAVADELPQFKLISKGTLSAEFKFPNLADKELDYSKLKVSRRFADGGETKQILIDSFQNAIINPSNNSGIAMYGDLGGHALSATYKESGASHKIGGIGKSERIKFLDWLCDTHGSGSKEAKDDMWFTTTDEIIQYKYLNEQTNIGCTVQGGVMTITLEVPEIEDFYWSEYTLLIDGLDNNSISGLDVDDSAIGYSTGNSNGKMMLNLNFDATLFQRANSYTDLFEKTTDINLKAEYKRDAEFFVQRLRPSLQQKFINRLNGYTTAVVSLAGTNYQNVTYSVSDNSTINSIMPTVDSKYTSQTLKSVKGDLLEWKIEKNDSFYKANSESAVDGTYLTSSSLINPALSGNTGIYPDTYIAKTWSLYGDTGNNTRKGRLVFSLPNGTYKFNMLMSVKGGSEGVVDANSLSSYQYRIDTNGKKGDPVSVGTGNFTGVGNTQFNAVKEITVNDGGKAGNIIFYLYNTNGKNYKPSINLIQIEKIK